MYTFVTKHFLILLIVYQYTRADLRLSLLTVILYEYERGEAIAKHQSGRVSEAAGRVGAGTRTVQGCTLVGPLDDRPRQHVWLCEESNAQCSTRTPSLTAPDGSGGRRIYLVKQ